MFEYTSPSLKGEQVESKSSYFVQSPSGVQVEL